MSSQRRRGRFRRTTNIALLLLLPLAALTGLIAQGIGTHWAIPAAAVHGIVGIAIVFLSPWKSVIVKRGLRRPGSRLASIVFLLLVLITLGTGLLHAGGYQGNLGPFTVMQVHIGGAVVALILLIAHYRSHPVRPRRQDLTRRTFLRSAGLASVAGVTWLAWEGVMDTLGLPGGERRFTGSHETASFQPEMMPVTSWLNDRVPQIDGEQWRVLVDGTELSLEDLAGLPQDGVTAAIDCTNGWYSNQVWSGVRLDHLLDAQDHRSIEVRSTTGYVRRYPTEDLGRIWLALHVGGEPLSPGHGFPARIVAPDRRGFWWVKWVTEITPSDTPAWLQSPFPLT